MGTRDAVQSTAPREFGSLLRRVGLALGLGFLVLVFVPVSTAVALVLSGGHEPVALGLLAFGLLGFLLILAVLPVAVVGVVSLLGLATASALGSYVTDRRLRVLRRVEAVEEARWWGPFVRPSGLLSFLDPRTATERFEATLDDVKSRYVSGELSDAEFERRLNSLFETGGTPSEVTISGHSDRARRSNIGTAGEGRRPSNGSTGTSDRRAP